MAARQDSTPCPAPYWLRGGHLQTIYSTTLNRYRRICFVRERVDTTDGDFIDFDWTAPGLLPDRAADDVPIKADPGLRHTAAWRWINDHDREQLQSPAGSNALILFHGLEGSSASHYAQAIAHHFRIRGWSVVVAHFRSCSGFPNRLVRAYHSGDTADVGFMLDTVRSRLPDARWHAMGVSLGGNALLKYLGRHAPHTQWLHACAAVSVPLDLTASGSRLSDSTSGRLLYTRHFLKTMRAKLVHKARQFPDVIDSRRLAGIASLREFDDLYTAPVHGYADVAHYWSQASSRPWLGRIAVPTLVLNARNDPFVPESSLPGINECSPTVLLHQPTQGGHAGFVTGRFPGTLDWLPQRLQHYFETAR